MQVGDHVEVTGAVSEYFTLTQITPAAGGWTVLDEAAEESVPLVLDYLALVDPADFTEIPDGREGGEAVLAVAARVGATRLIDNIPLTLGA